MSEKYEGDMLTTKYCRRCKMDLPVGQFHRNRRRPDGRAFYCRKCMAEFTHNWYDRTQEPKVIARQQEAEKERERIRNARRKECNRCRKLLPRSDFNQHKRTPDGLQGYCRTCQTEYERVYYDANPEKHEARKQYCRDWQRNLSPEKKKAARTRALLGRHGLTYEELTALYEACQSRCQVCNLHASENTWKGLTGQLCVDHVLVAGKRVVRGLLCNRCNSLLGRMGDDREGVLRYVRYLESYQQRKGTPRD
ncbi:MAG: hypothetical protein HYS12_02755 [Planctomycetes bacterium]|nr:hypothetical protein [Planctomycetota bacterium]